MNLSKEEQAEIWANINDPIKAKNRFNDIYSPSLGKSVWQRFEDEQEPILKEVNEQIRAKVLEEYEESKDSMNPFSVAGRIRAAQNKEKNPNTLYRQAAKFANTEDEKKRRDLDYINRKIGYRNYSDFIGKDENIQNVINEGKKEIDEIGKQKDFAEKIGEKSLRVMNDLADYATKKGGKAKRKTRRVKRKTGRKSKSSKKNKNKKTKKQNKTRKVKQLKKKGKK